MEKQKGAVNSKYYTRSRVSNVSLKICNYDIFIIKAWTKKKKIQIMYNITCVYKKKSVQTYVNYG